MSSTVLAPGQLFANIALAAPPNNPFVQAPAPTRTRKKIRVNLPKETLFFGDGRLPTRRSHFARTPIPPRLIPPQAPVFPPDVISADVYPPDILRVEIPNAIRVSLPGRSVWDALKQKFIGEELEKLGVEENDAESPMPPQIDVSISSPVDPALLSFKLNKLQQAQNSHHADIPDEAGEQQEPDSEEQVVMEVDEAEPMVAEVSRTVISGADETIDMELKGEDAFHENGSGSRNDTSNNANLAGEDEGEVQQNPRRHAVRIEDRLEALLESKLNGFREEVRTLRAEGLSTGQALQDKTSELLVLLSHLMDASGKTKKLADEEQSMIATNSDPQVKVQAEKDIVLEHISSKIDRLRAKVDEIQAVMLPRATDEPTSRNMELDETPSQSSSQFKKSDVTIESKQERLLDPENRVGELETVSKVHSQETQAGFSSRETDEAVDTLSALRKEIDARALQQSHMDDFRRTNEPEVKELHRICDRSKVLECECAALQRHYKEQEARVASSDRAVITARESLAQAQQLAAEWEQRAKESAAALEEAQALRGQAEDRAVRLEAEHVLLRMQLDEKERHAKERESKLGDQVSALEAQLMAADAARLDTCVTQ